MDKLYTCVSLIMFNVSSAILQHRSVGYVSVSLFEFSIVNPFSVYPGTVSGSTTRSHSVYPVTVTLLQPAITSTR